MSIRAIELAAYCDEWPGRVHEEVALELRRLAAEVESLKLAEEGAKEAFGHVVQEKRDLEKALKHCEANLHSAHEIIRNQAKAKFLEVKHG